MTETEEDSFMAGLTRAYGHEFKLTAVVHDEETFHFHRSILMVRDGKARKMKVRWRPEALDDLVARHGWEAKGEALKSMAVEIGIELWAETHPYPTVEADYEKWRADGVKWAHSKMYVPI